MSVALLPLALVGMLATLKSARMSAEESRARLGFASEESARALHNELAGDMNALKSAMAAMDADPGDLPSCARVTAILTRAGALSVRFVILGAQGQLLCGARFAEAQPPGRALDAKGIAATIEPGRGVVLSAGDGRRKAAASAFFETPLLARISHPTGFSSFYGATLIDGRGVALPLAALPGEASFDRRQTTTIATGVDSLALAMQVRSPPITSSLVVAFMLPLLMWGAAAGIAWFVADRLLIHPLRRLRASVAAYRPGDVIDTGETRALPAQELRDLGDTFRAISRTVAIHEAGLAEGLVRQTKLTREVHHRVKNNLQVISSLINIHARGAQGAGAAEAYASIQRRVDALAVVHRNHFADAEVNRGLPLRSMLSELASNIRATAPEEQSAQLAITMDVDSVLVNQDVAVAIAFLVTEAVELAMVIAPAPKLRISVKPETDARASLRVASHALADGEALKRALAQRYGRVMEGLARQLRAPLRRDGAAGSYEIVVPTVGQD